MPARIRTRSLQSHEPTSSRSSAPTPHQRALAADAAPAETVATEIAMATTVLPWRRRDVTSERRLIFHRRQRWVDDVSWRHHHQSICVRMRTRAPSTSVQPFRVQRQLQCHIKWYEVGTGTLAVDGRAVTFGTARRGLGGAPGPSSVYQM